MKITNGMQLKHLKWSKQSSTFEPRHDKTNKMSVRPTKTQISLGIRPVWSESSLCAQWVVKDPSFLHADSEDSVQTGRMPRLIWVFAGRTLILLVLSYHGSFHFLPTFVFLSGRTKSISVIPLYRQRYPSSGYGTNVTV